MATDSQISFDNNLRRMGGNDPKVSRINFTRPSHLSSIEDANALRLRINRVSLVQQLNVDLVMEFLRNHKILSDLDLKLIKRGSSKADRTRILLDILPTKDPHTQWYMKFRETLQQTGEQDPVTQRQHAMLVAFLDNTIVQRPLQLQTAASKQQQQQKKMQLASGKRQLVQILPGIRSDESTADTAETAAHKVLWKELKAAANLSKSAASQAPPACRDRLAELSPELVAAYRAWRTDKAESMLRREQKVLEQVRAADQFLACLKASGNATMGKASTVPLSCLHQPVKRLLKDARYSHMAYKHIRLLSDCYLVSLAPALAASYTALVGRFSGWSPFAAGKLARHGFRLFDFLEGLCEFRQCDLVAAALAEFASRGAGLASLVPAFRAGVRLMEARLNNAQLALADSARLAASEAAGRIVRVSFGQELLNQSELLALTGRLLLEQGSLLPAQTCFATAVNKVDLTDMNTVFKVLYYSLDVYLVRYEEIKAEKLAVACVQHANKFFKPHSPQYVKALLNYVKFSNTFKKDAFGVEVAMNAALFAHTVMGYEHPLVAEAQSLLALARLLAARSGSGGGGGSAGPSPSELALAAVQTGQNAYPAGHPLLAGLMVNFGRAVLLEAGQDAGAAAHPLSQSALAHCQLAVAALADALGERSPATAQARLTLGQLLALLGDAKQAGEQMRRAHAALARAGGQQSQLLQQPRQPPPPQQQQQQSRSHVLLRFLLEYAKFFRQSGQPQQALLLAKQVSDSTECYGAYIHWVDEALVLTADLLAETGDAEGSAEARKRRTAWLAEHPVYKSRLDWQSLNAEPDKAFFKKFNLWTERRARIMGKLKKQQMESPQKQALADADADSGAGEASKRLRKALKEFADNSDARFRSSGSSSSASSSDESSVRGDASEAKPSKKKALKKRKDLKRLKASSSSSEDEAEKAKKTEKDKKNKKKKSSGSSSEDEAEKATKTEKNKKNKKKKSSGSSSEDEAEKATKTEKNKKKKKKKSSSSSSEDEAKPVRKSKFLVKEKKAKKDDKVKLKKDEKKKQKEKKSKKTKKSSSSSSSSSSRSCSEDEKEEKKKTIKLAEQSYKAPKPKDKNREAGAGHSSSSSNTAIDDKKSEDAMSSDDAEATKKFGASPHPQEKRSDLLSLKVVLVGDSGVGKSSLMTRFVEGTFRTKMFSTVGVDYCTKQLELNGRQVRIQIWDTAGQERFRSLGAGFYRGADAAMLVFDASNRSSFDSCARWLEELRQVTDASRLSVILVANKTDLAAAGSSAGAVSREEAEQFVRQFGLAGYAEASALGGGGVSGAFKQLLKQRLALVGDSAAGTSQNGDGILLTD